jgi:DUF1365 family protein
VNSALYVGTVMHARHSPRDHVFRYPVYQWLIDLDELPELDRRFRLFGWNRRAVTSWQDADHIDIRAYLRDNGIDLGEGSRIVCLANLRVLGYVFNPVSFWWCYRSGGELACIVAEINNTFGERLPYLLSPANEVADPRRHAYTTDKRIHVSPFMSMDQRYTWFFSEPGERLSVRIDVHEEGMRPFHATFVSHRVELTPAAVRAALVRYPLMPAKVISLIHLNAALLKLKRVPFFHKPPFVAGEGTVKP